ncbi:hypothetical protein [Nostoc commune]|uniref:hypothetical protein n=1 Tax=Nostoc commune TaxID=1178 RepID=UPI0018C4708E|nr:hypothetical protein [Nostoc commune]MBG1263986.1 hypothetical protein [Nostoc commune BAE]
MSTWDDLAQELVEKLSTTKKEATVKKLASKVIGEIRDFYGNENSRKKPLSIIRKAVLEAYPDTETKEYPLQYFTDKGKGNVERYQHLVLKYLTLSTQEWDAVGDDAREEWKAEQAEKSQVLQPTETVTVKTTKKQTTLDDMNISQMQLDAETEELVKNTIEQAGISLADFVRRACQVYAKTLVGKAKQFSEDLTAVPTKDLKSDSYKTHPGRADELARRAIYALEMHNNTSTEKAQKWHINQTAIQAITGSKPATIKAILENYQTRLDDHNAKHDLNPYDNRKGGGRKIDLEIDLVALVPDGLDVT